MSGNWTRGYGIGLTPTAHSDYQAVSLSLDTAVAELTESLAVRGAPNVGARLTAKTRCTDCGKQFQAGDVMTAELAWDMAGTFHHTDCEDPQLENLEDA